MLRRSNPTWIERGTTGTRSRHRAESLECVVA
jgi:hypothetical protein